MFYSEYSDYSPGQIIDDNYKQVAEMILNLATTYELKNKLNGILYEGGFEQFSVNLGDQDYIPRHKDSPRRESERRLQYAYFLAKNPEVMEVMVKDNTILFHGTKIDALPNILKYGMNSVDESAKKGIDVSTGEEWSRISGKRSFISFTNSLEVALGYASLSGKNKDSKDASFGVMIGMAPEALEHLDARSIDSDIEEIGIMDNIPLEYIKTLTVPKEKVEFVRKLVGDIPIKVMGAEMEDPFFHMSMIEKAEYLRQPEKVKQDKTKEYTKEDMRKVAQNTKLSRIINLFNDVKNKFFNKKGNDRGKRYEPEYR